MSANTLTGLIPTMQQALDVVSRELVGAIPAVTRNSSAARVAKDQTINYRVVPAMSASDITPAAVATDPTGLTMGYDSMTISKSRKVPFRWSGEEELSIQSAKGVFLDGTDPYAGVLREEFAQAFRTLANEVEVDLTALYIKGSRAYGSAGTSQFNTAGDFSDFAQLHKILDDNGAPASDRHLVLGSAAIANLRGKQSVLFKANEAGTSELLRRGIIGQVMGWDIHNSYPIAAVTKGTGASYQTNHATYPVGTTTIALDTGSGTILAGDTITFTGDSNKYVVTTALSAGSLTIAAPGLRQTLADDVACTVGNTATSSLAFSRNAIHLVTRAPAMPVGGDAAKDVIEVTDPVSGLAFQVAVYPGYRMTIFEVGLAWGVKVVKPEHLAISLG